MSCIPKTFLLTCGLSLGLALPAVFAQEDSTVTDYDAYEQEEYVAPGDEGEARPLHFSEISTPLPFRERAIDAAQWQKLSADDVFRYTDDQPEVKPAQQEEDSWFIRMLGSIFEFFRSAAGKALIWIVIAAFLLFLVFRIFKLNGNVLFARKDKKLQQHQDETADDYVPENWEQSIAEAAQAGNYRLAVRHGYRYLLHLMHEQGKIRFETAKTNYQYAYELSGSRWHQPFMQLTRQYEYAWYGGFDIGQEQYETYYRLLTETRRSL
ncbi:DUF4129 domain-containing protein [Taibaiella chishuiensis]|uniref:Uncharacterized protein DUF4129 n=1 Tax=Taibaiella chishuiensis TaxID=1434707 RepID=A0A2P8D654_9BACT|nr:DUF4129 domain-containing protein [Taibaiella chishuiensis]PSK92687.1 uncharacterized protein DUF4129 [Taibaiella chishuiensis]